MQVRLRWLLPVLWASVCWAAGSRRSELILPGTPAETPWYVVDSGQPGPTVWISGGVHGNEPAGAAAAAEILHWTVVKGRLVVLPRANVLALKADRRTTPDEAAATSNLNRDFPAADGEDVAKGPLAVAIWHVLTTSHPDWVIDLHEGFDFTKANQKSVGSSLIHARTPQAEQMARLMQTAVNAAVSQPGRKLVLKSPPVDTSLARAAYEHLHVPSMTLETTSKDQPLSLRVREHRLMVHRLLAELGMVTQGPDVLVDRQVARELVPPGTEPLLVALYDGPGSLTSPGPPTLDTIHSAVPGVLVRRVGPDDLRAGALAQFDVVEFPGGTGSGQGTALGEQGRDAVRAFVRAGGGYVGHCAGSYLATTSYSWSLGLINARVVDSQHWARGTGRVTAELAPTASKVLAGPDVPFEVEYANGPLLAPADKPNLPPYEPWAWYRSEIDTNGAPPGVMVDTPAIITSVYGKGRVICFSPHPEYTPGLEAIPRAAIRWAARRDQAK